ncbi:pentapeptide repeat-containing protein [Amycolatopsis silviterrae]|uniref:Pentapeptide repeat-containing protein n=1 Tax=Amycolatopsis silviterrae TaxID=1656914 RepID=A0ABW5H4X8_9PSEU
MRSPLLWTLIASAVLLCGVGGWLLTDPATSRSEALKTAGLAGGAVVALYALWLNDRRRRVEEARQTIEQQRHDVDRERISDERFAKSVELLGHEADQVRVGALHALAGLARTRPEYRQTVLDVLCSYLRRPFTHGRYGGSRHDGTPEEERELQVRLTAQRLIRDLLPPSDVDGPGPDLDLTGAVLEYFDLSHRRIGGLLLRHASLYSSTNLSGCVFTGQAYFTAAGTGPGRLVGVFRCRNTAFLDRAWFSGTEFSEWATFSDTTFAGRTTFKGAKFAKDVMFDGASFADSAEVQLPEGWQLEPGYGGYTAVRS